MARWLDGSMAALKRAQIHCCPSLESGPYSTELATLWGTNGCLLEDERLLMTFEQI